MKSTFVLRFGKLCLIALCAAPVLASCSKPPYSIIDRKTEDPAGIVVKIRADVPASATKEQMEGWCAEITAGEDKDTVVSVEFLEEGAVIRQKGLCFDGKVYS